MHPGDRRIVQGETHPGGRADPPPEPVGADRVPGSEVEAVTGRERARLEELVGLLERLVEQTVSPGVRRLTGATFKSLKTRNYRLWFVGQTISVSGTWMRASLRRGSC